MTTSPPTSARSCAPLHSAITNLVRGDAPVVAAVQGSAAGAGMGFVGASDLVVAAESAKFVMAYTGVGLAPDGSSSWFLPRMVGLRRALELTLTNRVLSAAEALDWGLITQVVPDDELADSAGALAAKVASGAAPALARAKRLLHTSLEETLESHLAREAEAISSASGTPEGIEGRGRVRREAQARLQPRLSRSGPSRAPWRRARRGGRRASCASASSCAPRMRTASSPALRALPTPTVATGMPSGICTIDSSESRPSRCCERHRHADHRAATSSTRSCPAGARRRRRRR